MNFFDKLTKLVTVLSELIVFYSKKRKKAQFREAYKEFNNQKRTENKLNIEWSFNSLYKKQASYILIKKLAESSLGPSKSFELFAYSSPRYQCDFNNHRIIKRGKEINNPIKRILFTISISIITIAAAITYIGAAIYFTILLAKIFRNMSFTQLLAQNISNSISVALYSILTIGLYIFGITMLIYANKILGELNSSRGKEIEKLMDEVNK